MARPIADPAIKLHFKGVKLRPAKIVKPNSPPKRVNSPTNNAAPA